MAIKENKEKMQISWRDLGDNIIADLPGNETLTFDVRELHESWKDFMLRYGIRQYVSSALAKMSYSMDSQLKIDIIDCQVRASSTNAAEKLEAEKELVLLKERARTAKAAWLKEHAAEIRTFLWKEFQALKVEKVLKAAAERETKAQVEARVKSEMLAKMRASFEAQGFDEETIKTIMANL